MVTELLQKYIWLVQTFVRAGKNGLSLSEIEDRWESRFDLPYSRRSLAVVRTLSLLTVSGAVPVQHLPESGIMCRSSV